jgi:hypothetical protein
VENHFPNLGKALGILFPPSLIILVTFTKFGYFNLVSYMLIFDQLVLLMDNGLAKLVQMS